MRKLSSEPNRNITSWLPTIHPEPFFGFFHNPLSTAIRLARVARAISHRRSIGCRRYSLTSAKLGAINSTNMFRAVRVAFALLSIFSIAYVLATPNPTDDVTAVLQRSHFGKAQKLAVWLVRPLAQQIVIFRLLTPSSSPNQQLTILELIDIFCTYRC